MSNTERPKQDNDVDKDKNFYSDRIREEENS